VSRLSNAVGCDHGAVKAFTVTIEGMNWEDVAVIELPALPREGDRIETKYGTCVVTHAEPLPDNPYAGKIVCRFPGAHLG
jgi:hypothetical protein